MFLITAPFASGVLIWALLRTPWRRLKDSSAQHVLFGACVATLMLWTLQIDFGSGLALHFLGITTLTLMFGWPLALVAGAIVTVASPLADLSTWTNLPGVFVSQCATHAA